MVNKTKLKEIVADFSAIESDNVEGLTKACQEYPYAQVLHTLLAKGSKKFDSPDYNKHLNFAALYTSDRKILKAIIQDTFQEPYSNEPATMVEQEAEIVVVEKGPEESAEVDETPIHFSDEDKDAIHKETDADQLRDEIYANLRQLKNKIKPYEDEEQVQQPTAPKKPTTRRKAAAEALSKEQNTDEEPDVIKELKTKKKKKPKGKQKEQIDLINNFIKSEPSIKKNQLEEVDSSEKQDLALKSIEFGENLVSENLAKIFIKQGKTEKAIDIYKKLIWKFPQKKAYFAACIEELKKE